MSRPLSLYVHIPFCKNICPYCDFCKLFYREDWSESYLKALAVELSFLPRKKMDTIYIGGGTPSCLEEPQLNFLLSILAPFCNEDTEFTLEANPEDVTPSKARLFSRYGVNRVSMGVQTSSPFGLRLLGRNHSFDRAKEAVSILREVGISNLNCDMIYAYPGETLDDLKEDLAAFASLNLPHLSAYSLILEDSTIFSAQGVKEAPLDLQGQMMEIVTGFLTERGYLHYEISNYCRPGFECRHNLTYWQDRFYYGVGLGASGYVPGIRYANTKSLPLYIKSVSRGKVERSEEKVEPKEDLTYYLLCNLRLSQGFSEEEFKRKFGAPFLFLCPGATKPLKFGLLHEGNGRIFCSEKGMRLLDSVLLDLIP